MSLIISLDVSRSEELVSSLQKARSFAPSPAITGQHVAKGSSSTTVPQFLLLGTVPQQSASLCTSSVGRLLHRIRLAVAKQRSVKLAWALHDASAGESASSTATYALHLSDDAIVAVSNLQSLLHDSIGLEVPQSGGDCTAPIPIGAIARSASGSLTPTLSAFTDKVVRARSLCVMLSNVGSTPRQLGIVEFSMPPTSPIYRSPSVSSNDGAPKLLQRREVHVIEGAFEKNMTSPSAVTEAAIARATAWVHARRAMGSLPKSRAAWENTLQSFGRAQVRCDPDRIVDRMVASNFLERTTAKVADPSRKISMIFLGPKATGKHRYKRAPEGFDSKKLETGQTLRKFSDVKDAPAFSIKVKASASPASARSDSSSATSTAADAPVPPPQLGDAVAFQARMKRGMKQLVSQLRPKRGTEKAVISEERFKKAVQDLSIVRAHVPASDIVDALLAAGTLVEVQDTKSGVATLVPGNVF